MSDITVDPTTRRRVWHGPDGDCIHPMHPDEPANCNGWLVWAARARRPTPSCLTPGCPIASRRDGGPLVVAKGGDAS